MSREGSPGDIVGHLDPVRTVSYIQAVRRLAVTVLMAVLVAGCSGGDSDNGPSAVVTAPERTTTTLSAVEREVEAAYLKSWDVYADALVRLSDERLPESFAGEALASTRREIADLAARNTPVRVSVEHRYRIDLQTASTALVADRPINRSVTVDPVTGEPTEPEPNKRVGYDYTMEEVRGTWRVTGVVRRF